MSESAVMVIIHDEHFGRLPCSFYENDICSSLIVSCKILEKATGGIMSGLLQVWGRSRFIAWAGTVLLSSGTIAGYSNAYAVEKPEIFVQKSINSIYSVAISPDGRYALSGSDDKTVKLWEISTGRQIRKLEGHTNRVCSVAFSPDGQYAASGSLDTTVRLWELSTGREMWTLKGHSYSVSSVVFSPKGRYVASGGWDSTVRLWDVSTGKDVWTLHAPSDVESFAVSPDGQYVLLGSLRDIGVKLWEMSTDREVRTLKGHSGGVLSVAFSPDGRYALSGGSDKTVRLWELSTGKELKTFKGHPGDVRSVVFSPDGKYVLSGSAFRPLEAGSSVPENHEETIKLWEVSTGREVRTLRGHSEVVNSIVFSPDGRYALSGGTDETIKLWEISTGREIRTLRGHSSAVYSLAISPDGRYAITANDDKTAKLWEISTGREVRELRGHSGPLSSVAFSPDGRYALTGSDDKTVKLWEVSTGKEVRTLKGHPLTVMTVAISPDGRYVLSGVADLLPYLTDIILWEVATGREVRRLKGHVGVLSVAFSPDGQYALSGGMHDSGIKHSGGIKLWEVSTGREIRTLAGHESSVNSVAFSADGRYAISGGSYGDDTIKLWDLSTGKEVTTLRGHSGTVSSVAFSPDGRYALSGGRDDQTVKLWEVSTGREIRTLRGHASSVRSVAFSPNGRHIFSGSVNGDTRIWNLDTGNEICTMVGFNDGEWIAITPEGYYNSSLNGHKYLNVRMGMKVYGIDQFYDVFYRPDILMAKLKGEDIKPLITLTIDDAIKNPPPEVDFTTVPSNSTSPQAKVCYQAKDTGGGIGEVRLFHNGKLIQSDGFYRDVDRTTAGKIRLASLDSKSIREDMRSIVVKSMMDVSPIVSKAKGGDIFKDCVVVDAIPGENEVSISAFNKNNTVQSYMKTTSFTANIKAEDSHLYMMIVGIDQYNDQSVNLKYAVKDAKDIKDKLIRQSKTLYKPENIHSVILTDKEATKANIQSQLSILSKEIKPADGFILFVAGHGVLLQNQYFMLTHDFNGTIRDSSMISSNEIVEASKQIKSLSQLFIFDTCHAGGVDYIVSGLYDARMSVLAKKMGLHIYASANDQQAAMDGYNGNGLFTYTLLAGLNNNKDADKYKDGKVSIVGLGEYSKQTTTNISKEIGHSQTPLIINFGKDSPIYKLQ